MRPASTPARPDTNRYGASRAAEAAATHAVDPVRSKSATDTATIPSDCPVPANAWWPRYQRRSRLDSAERKVPRPIVEGPVVTAERLSLLLGDPAQAVGVEHDDPATIERDHAAVMELVERTRELLAAHLERGWRAPASMSSMRWSSSSRPARRRELAHRQPADGHRTQLGAPATRCDRRARRSEIQVRRTLDDLEHVARRERDEVDLGLRVGGR